MDIVERLRKCANGFPLFKTIRGDFGICDEAADEIRRLQSALLQQSTDNIDLRHDLARANEKISQLQEELAKPVLVGRTQIKAYPVTDSYLVYPIRSAPKDGE